MGKDILSSIQTEQINTPEELLGKLYDRTVEWLKENGGKVIKEFEPKEIENWEKSYDFHKGSHSSSLGLLKACVVEDSRKIFLLTLGFGRKSQHGGDSLRLQFGFFPTAFEQAQITEALDIRGMKWILNQGVLGSVGSGEIFARTGSGKIGVNCWANDFPYGGKNIGTWPSEKILTTQGLEESFNIIKRTVQRAFGEDLT